MKSESSSICEGILQSERILELHSQALYDMTLYRDKHIQFVVDLDKQTDTVEYHATEHLRISGIYWGLTTLHLLNAPDALPRDGLIDFIWKCYDAEIGGFAGAPGHDVHLLYTLSAIQILALCNALDTVDRDKVAAFVSGLQQPDGSFIGDKWGEVDSRFSYCGLSCLALLDRLSSCNVEKAADFVVACRNWDGSFGAVPHAESHAGQVFCCVGALYIAKQIHRIDADALAWWLSERQIPSVGGLNGRPQKLADVCYSWWVLSALKILGRESWIDADKLVQFVLDAQDEDGGGFADRPGDMADVFHTFFGVGGLSLLGWNTEKVAGSSRTENSDTIIQQIDPVYALPVWLVKELGLTTPLTDQSP